MPVYLHSPERYWYSMPLAATDLVRFQKSGELSEDVLLTVLMDVWQGLNAAHTLGHFHRDVTPKNILKVDDRWLVSDFGLVTKGERESFETITRTGAVLGTVGFIAPEVITDPRNASPESDVYSLGMVASWALTGVWPREGKLVALPDTEWAEFASLAAQSKPSDRMLAIEWLAGRWNGREKARRRLEYDAWRQARYGCFNCQSMAGFIGPEQRCVRCGAINPDRAVGVRV